MRFSWRIWFWLIAAICFVCFVIGLKAATGVVKLDWNPSQFSPTPVIGYRVYQSGYVDENSRWNYTNAFDVKGTGTTISGLIIGTWYYFSVAALSTDTNSTTGLIQSKLSNDVMAQPTLAASTNGDFHNISIQWKDNGPGISYVIRQATNNAFLDYQNWPVILQSPTNRLNLHDVDMSRYLYVSKSDGNNDNIAPIAVIIDPP